MITTTIQISDKLWTRLNKLKKQGQTFEDVILDILKLTKKKEIKNENTQRSV